MNLYSIGILIFVVQLCSSPKTYHKNEKDQEPEVDNDTLFSVDDINQDLFNKFNDTRGIELFMKLKDCKLYQEYKSMETDINLFKEKLHKNNMINKSEVIDFYQGLNIIIDGIENEIKNIEPKYKIKKDSLLLISKQIHSFIQIGEEMYFTDSLQNGELEGAIDKIYLKKGEMRSIIISFCDEAMQNSYPPQE